MELVEDLATCAMKAWRVCGSTGINQVCDIYEHVRDKYPAPKYIQSLDPFLSREHLHCTEDAFGIAFVQMPP